MSKQLIRSVILTGVSVMVLNTPGFAEDVTKNIIPISAEQASSLGIKTVPLMAVGEGAGTELPAKAVIPNNQLRVVGAPLEGVIESVQIAVGEAVKDGQVLAELKSPSLIDEQRQFLHALSAVQVARSAMSRDNELLKEGIIAKSRHQSTRSASTQAEADLDEKRQALALFGMQPDEIKALETSHKIINTVKIVSPLNGFVLEQTAIAGQRVEAASPLYKIGVLKPMWVEIHMPAAQVVHIKEGDAVAVPAFGASGKVISIGKTLDAANQTIMVRAEITENAEKLHPEQIVMATIEVAGNGKKQWQLPPAAIVRQDGKAYVFVKTVEGFRAQEVNVENANATAITISGALEDNDQVAADGVLGVKGKWQGLGGGE